MQRYDIINFLIESRGYKKYLEIGVQNGYSFHSVNCEKKTGVDPNSQYADFKITSDEFFSYILGVPCKEGSNQNVSDDSKYDIIFIDGLHTEDQVLRDIENSLTVLNKGGIIVLHDCNPPTEWHARSEDEARENNFVHWNGTVWRAFVRFREKEGFYMCTVDTDWGCGIIEPVSEDRWNNIKIKDELTYHNLQKNRGVWLNLIGSEDFRAVFQA